MRKQIGWFIAALMMSGTAYAQEPTPAQMMQGAVEKVQADLTALDANEQAAEARRDLERGWRPAHPKMKRAGWVVMFIGAAWMIPTGDTYRILGEDVCVTSYEVEAGGCSNPPWKQISAAAMMGTGFALVKIGGRHVAVSPTVTRQVVGVQTTYQWGGSKRAEKAKN